MTRSEIITRMCEINSGLADLKGQTEQLCLEFTQLMEQIQADAEL